ncbi:unnamed protein product [Penicillium manginii]
MESRNDFTTAQTYYQKPRFASAESRASSPEGSQDTTEFDDSNVHDDPRSRSFAAGTDHKDFDTKQPSPSRYGRWTSKYGSWTSLEDTWILECFAMAFSFASFIAVIIILRAYDQKPSPNLSYGLTLNTIVSLLATSSRSSLLFVVAGARREKSVLDMQSFDDASRGPLGAFYLFFQHRGLSIASLGAIVTVLSIALDPFVQQILSYPVQQTPGTSTTQATMAQALNFIPDENYNLLSRYFYGALWNTDFAVNPTCPSGNCTWPEFQSLGFCSKCQDVTESSILYDCDQWTETPDDMNSTDRDILAFGRYYDCDVNAGYGGNGTIKVNYHPRKKAAWDMQIPTGIVWGNLGYKRLKSALGVPYPVYSFAHAEFEVEGVTANITDFIRKIRFKSVQGCVISPCLRTYNVSVSSGTPQINITSVDWGVRFGGNLSLYDDRDDGYHDIDCWRPTNRPGPFNFVNITAGNLADTKQFVFCLQGIPENWSQSGFHSLNTLWSSSPFLGYRWTVYRLDKTTSLWSYDPKGGWGNSANFMIGYERILEVGFAPFMSNIAAALTKYTMETSNTSAHGTVMVSQAFVKVSWQWLTFPSVLLVAGFVFWITTVIKNRQHRLGLWKSSILPMLYCGAEKLDPRLERPGSAAEYTKISQMSQSAQVTRVKMEDIMDGRLRLGQNKWSEPSVF